MNKSCLNQNFLPGASRLLLDYLYDFDRVSTYYDWHPFNAESYSGAAAKIQFPIERRTALVEALAKQNPGAKAIETLRQPNSVAVVTGQQVGLFSGPAYTVYKALTAAKLARQLSSEGIPAVAIFWLATEDHDLAEVDHAWLFDRKSNPVCLKSRMTPTGGPVGATVLEEPPLAELEQTLDGFPYRDDVVAMVRRAYRPGVTLGSAFRNLAAELLKDLGLLFLDPLAPDIRTIAAPFLADLVGKTSELMPAIEARSSALQAAGYPAQVFVDGETSPVFLLDGGRRVSFKRKGDRFVNRQDNYSAADLQARAQDISPNALLRPVMQDFILPTVAYVAGPAEIAYMAQSQVAYHALLGRMPVIVPRNGFTLLDEHTVKLLDRYQMQVPEVFGPRDQVQMRIASRLVPAALHTTLANTQHTIDAAISNADAELAHFDPTLKAALAKCGAKIRYQMEKLARKTEREAFRREEQAQHAADYLVHQLYPERHLQERFYTILPFIAQHGLNLVDRLWNATQLDCPDHMARALADMPAPALLYSN